MINQNLYKFEDGVLTFAPGLKHIREYMIPEEIRRTATKVVLPNTIKTIEKYAFGLFISMKSINIPNSVKQIGDYAFHNCSSLEHIDIGKGLKAIGTEAFIGCENVNVYIEDIASWCKIRFDSFISNPAYYTSNLYLNNKLIENLIIPEGVSFINKNAFINNLNIKTVYLPTTIKNIETGAFFNTEIKSVHISDLSKWCKVTLHSQVSNPMFRSADLFLNDKKVVDLAIPLNIEHIGSYAFCGANIKRVKINQNISSIGYGAFLGCNNLKLVMLPKTIKYIDHLAFDSCSKNLAFKCDETDYIKTWLKDNKYTSVNATSSLNSFLTSVIEDVKDKSF